MGKLRSIIYKTLGCVGMLVFALVNVCCSSSKASNQDGEGTEMKFIRQRDGSFKSSHMQRMTYEDFQSMVVGKAWKYVEGHSIQEDGTLVKWPYAILGSNIPPLYFSKDTIFALRGVLSEQGYGTYTEKHQYRYKPETNSWVVDSKGYKEYYTILVYDQVAHAMKLLYQKRWKEKNMYVYMIYQRMTDSELLSVQKKYNCRLPN